MVAAFYILRPGYYLTLRNGTTDEVIARYAVEDGSSFSVGFIHSVNKSPFIDVYHIQEGEIITSDTIYYAFGAGVETVLDDSYTLEILDDGAMLLGNLNRNAGAAGVTYSVSVRSDHTLVLGDILTDYEAVLPYIGVVQDSAEPIAIGDDLSVVSLTTLAGQHTLVNITYAFSLW